MSSGASTSEPAPEGPRGPIDLRRGSDARLRVSRIAADLFWAEGLTAARGEDIAAAAGISPRTLWRYFRSKEACAEPVLTLLTEPLVQLFLRWPEGVVFEDFLADYVRVRTATFSVDQMRGMRLIALAREEPALRGIWLSVCDDAERAVIPTLAARLGDGDIAVEVAAAVAGANRALNDRVSYHVVDGHPLPENSAVIGALSRALLDYSGGHLRRATPSDRT